MAVAKKKAAPHRQQKKRHTISPAGRKRIADAQRKRWKAFRERKESIEFARLRAKLGRKRK